MLIQSQRTDAILAHPETPPATADGWLAPILVRSAVLTPDQTVELVAAGAGVWRGASERGWATDESIVAAIAHACRLQVADLAKADARTADLIPEKTARRYGVVPLSADDRAIRIATADPNDYDVEQSLRFVAGRDVVFQIAAPAAIAEKLDELYRPERSIQRLLSGLQPAEVVAVDDTTPAVDRDPILDAPVAKLVDAMISDGVREGASDIHAEPTDGAVVVRYRIDGVLKEVMRLPESAGAALVRRVKVWAKLDVTDPLRPHDGRASARVDGQTVDLRVSTIPIARRGEKVVIRILDRTMVRGSIDDIGVPAHEQQLLQRLLGFREGMVLVTGPTGSGKTTTLYATLNQLKTGKVNIVTVEDPVEYDIAGISQIQVNEAQSLTFAKALRSVLRQDPDILLIGEIRDAETAAIAVQAGFSGHFVLSTLHTNDAPSAIVRLRDMGIEGFKIASVLKGVVAQRLVRRLCDDCAEPAAAESLPSEARPGPDWTAPVRLRRPVGCRACSGAGYRGRAAIMEIMLVDETVARLIDAGELSDTIAQAARKAGFRTLWESGLERVWTGTTSIDELERVLGERVHDDATADPADPMTAVALPRTAPAAGAVPASRLPAAAAEPGPGATRILVADDDPQMRRLIRSVLTREGFEVVEAADGLEALELIESGPIDLAVLDFEMPRLDGLGVLEELRAQMRTAGLPVIMLTSHAGETEEKALDLGAHDYLTKPVQTRSLVARVKAVLKRVRG
jgi:type II secretory ATPase GspE/PulE/Tfp pilus assembly ATPase PilB-like protein/ActR/RegA family two-component response regulator